MRKIYNEFFHIPEEGQDIIREKVFFARLFVSLALIVLCMFAMGYNAYAYFTCNVTSSANVLQSATYSFDRSAGTIQVVGEQGSASAGTEEGQYVLAPGTYDLILSNVGDDINGYGRIDVLNGTNVTSFFTRQIVKGNPCKIRIQVEAETTIRIVACWGTYADADNALKENDGVQTNPEMIHVDLNQNATKVSWAEPTLNILSEEQPAAEGNDTNVGNNPTEDVTETLPGETPGEDNQEETSPEATNPEDTNPEDTNPEDTSPEDTSPEGENAGDANDPEEGSAGEEPSEIEEPSQDEAGSENAVEKKEEGV